MRRWTSEHPGAIGFDPNATDDVVKRYNDANGVIAKFTEPYLALSMVWIQKIENIKSGDGVTFPKRGDSVSVHYTGTLKSNGKKFDSSRDRGKPFVCKIGVGHVIQGWDVGFMKLSLGQKAILHITSDYAYGPSGVGNGLIPGNADLDFEVELLKIN